MKWFLCTIKNGVVDTDSEPLGIYENMADGIKAALKIGVKHVCFLVSEQDYLSFHSKINSINNSNLLS